MKETDWAHELKPLITKYKNKKHPLDYGNLYQLMVMVILSAQDSDAHINKIAPALFAKYPTLKALAKAEPDDIEPLIGKVRNFKTKYGWLIEIAQTLKDDKNIPTTMPELTALKGIGRKSANVIMREAEVKAEGILVGLHVLRVVPRLGISQAKTGDKMEKDLMAILPQEMWGEVGMAISFLGRETCRPTNPKHSECLLSDVCEYCKAQRE
ncbi:MAG: DNA lyase [Flavobacterium sp. BFFFF1]|uniref:endonuclease III domain-containing protein n=1 Tax=Flavobacterium sp. BFFFF1 TaxID=2015557 RepID=UPI000BDB8BB1|nr:endonuclease III [Flavobacterium sp. BFFFF1]OYU79065.1 MAG: DNA lyase [Flavobacterium sp. BFFFF1]